ncbi:MAG: hypothetical protein JNK69_05195 [Saprospiraceae bacterium]|nr:hypothetical protein [Saprospiraceae bacterium]MCC6843237.1 hypothetical protein [Saprospiraceae bacterium]
MKTLIFSILFLGMTVVAQAQLSTSNIFTEESINYIKIQLDVHGQVSGKISEVAKGEWQISALGTIPKTDPKKLSSPLTEEQVDTPEAAVKTAIASYQASGKSCTEYRIQKRDELWQVLLLDCQ